MDVPIGSVGDKSCLMVNLSSEVMFDNSLARAGSELRLTSMSARDVRLRADELVAKVERSERHKFGSCAR